MGEVGLKMVSGNIWFAYIMKTKNLMRLVFLYQKKLLSSHCLYMFQTFTPFRAS